MCSARARPHRHRVRRHADQLLELRLPDPEPARGRGDGCVAYLQEQLNRSQVTPTIAVDGNFGPATEAAVLAFQRYVDANYTGLPYPGLSVDGVAGVQTRTDLDTWDNHVGQ
ncbi:peptidoglycan-binding protein [Streptacidiphilus sp. 4-A2]|nr:peptidoglycan-binding protein [Streptacidiphilus sp. 4-A2]